MVSGKKPSKAIVPMRDMRRSCTRLAFHLGIALTMTFSLMLSTYRFAGVLSMVAFVAYCVYILLEHTELIFKYLLFFFGICTNVLGCVCCEYADFYLVEMACRSGFHGSLPLLITSRWLFMEVIVTYERKRGFTGPQDDSERDIWARSARWIEAGSYAVLCLAAVLFISVVDHPSFLVNSYRLSYLQTYIYTSRILTLIDRYMNYLIVISALGLRLKRKWPGLAGLALYLLYLVWVGVKFGGLFYVVTIIALAHANLFRKISAEAILRIALSATIVLGALVSFAVIRQSALSNLSSGDYLWTRLAQQGQLWWKTYEVCDGNAHPERWGAELVGLSHPESTSSQANVGSRYGIYGIMYLTVPTEIVTFRLQGGYYYTEAGHAAAYASFGTMGTLLFSALMALLITLTQNALLRALFGERLVSALLLARLSTILNTALSMFLFANLLKPLSVLSIAFLVLASRLSKRVYHLAQIRVMWLAKSGHGIDGRR